MRKKVLQFVGSFHQGGSERQAVQLTRLLKNDGEFEVRVATLDKAGPLLLELDSDDYTGIREFKLQNFYGANFVRQLNSCRAYMRSEKVDIVHSHDFYTNVFGMFAARLAGISARIASKRETGGIRSRPQEVVERVAYRCSHAITVNSKAVEQYLVNAGIAESKIHLVYNGIDVERLKPRVCDRAKICEMLGIPHDKLFVTLVANVRHGVKNQPMLLRCAAHLMNDFPDVHFVFAGEGDGVNALKALANDIGVGETCHFVGRCQIVPELLSISEACVLTSYHEGFSNSILEYMAAGKPIIATNVGGAGECIEDAENGFLVPSDDDDALAARLRVILTNSDLAGRFGNLSRRIVESKFSIKTQLETTKRIYRDLVEQE